MDELEGQAQPQGVHLVECAGNTRAATSGMISVAGWHGVPPAPLLDRLGFDREARILVSGFDEYSAKPLTRSIPGASWIFSRLEIENSRALLAIAMNGKPLTPDDGAPVRLVLPGWYGCACIKWVNEISPVEHSAAATSQMREYATRTHQYGVPERAIDYQPATIDPAAMPVRVEKRMAAGKLHHGVVGIVWGGSQPVDKLLLRFGPDEPYVPVSHANPVQGSWGLWTQNRTPKSPGTYRIRLRLPDPAIRTRRPDEGFYVPAGTDRRSLAFGTAESENTAALICPIGSDVGKPKMQPQRPFFSESPAWPPPMLEDRERANDQTISTSRPAIPVRLFILGFLCTTSP